MLTTALECLLAGVPVACCFSLAVSDGVIECYDHERVCGVEGVVADLATGA